MIQIRRLDSVKALDDARRVCDAVWVNPNNGTEITSNLLRALQHSGGYVAAAYLNSAPKVPIGAIVSFVGRHKDAFGSWHTHLHSHMNAVLPEHRNLGIGTLLKLDQRAWAIENDIDTISWTFDPLVRRNLRINVLKLGIGLHAYEENFYGLMDDSLNAGDETDRLVAWWQVQSPAAVAAISGQVQPLVNIPQDAHVVEIPSDIVELRKSDPTLALQWRHKVRNEIQTALSDGLELLGINETDFYVFGRNNAN